MKLLSIITAVVVLSSRGAHAFVPRNTQPARSVDTARPVLRNLDVESFLTKAKAEFEKFVQFEPPETKKDTVAAKKAAFQHDFQQATADATHQGGDAHYQNPAVVPSKLSSKEKEECQEIIIDYATGDELCWGESPLAEHKNYRQLEQEPVAQNTAMQYASISVRDEYHKGGNARYLSDSMPRTLKDSGKECDEEHRYIDFQSGDKLCWAN